MKAERDSNSQHSDLESDMLPLRHTPDAVAALGKPFCMGGALTQLPHHARAHNERQGGPRRSSKRKKFHHHDTNPGRSGDSWVS